MKIYKLTQDINNDYDTYDSVIVCAENEGEAIKISPKGGELDSYSGVWVGIKDINKIKIEEIGKANKNQSKGVILASFNAG